MKRRECNAAFRAAMWWTSFWVTSLLLLWAGIGPSGVAASERGLFVPRWHPPMVLPALDASALARAEVRAEAMEPLTSFLVAHRGELLVEYYHGVTPQTQVNIKSASKSILSILVGIAIEEGFLDGVEQPITEFFPDYFARPDVDSVKRTITLEDLLTMRPGLASTSGRNYGPWAASSNWSRYVLDQPLEHLPGERMIYSTGTSHLVSVILTRATGMSTLAFARQYLMEPLGIHLPAWDRDPQGYYLGGNNMVLAPRELLTIGHLYMNRGRIGERQLVPEAWVEASVIPRTRSPHSGNLMGYFWWSRTFDGYDAWFARGYGGQYLFIVPALDLVVVCTSSLAQYSRSSRGHNRDLYELLEHYVLAAVTPAMEAERRWQQATWGAR